MIQDVIITNYRNESITLSMTSPEQSGLFIKKIDGLGPVKATINIVESLAVDGGVYNSAHATTRNIVFLLGFLNDGSDSIENIRQKTYKYFPIKSLITITVVSDNRTLVTTGYVESNTPNIFSQKSDTLISVICPDAYWEAENEEVVTFAGVESGFEFPFSNESLISPVLEFSSLITSLQSSVYYSGDVSTGVTIHLKFYDYVSYLSIYSLTEQKIMEINQVILGYYLPGGGFFSGDELIINTRVGQKGVYCIRSGTIYNIFNAYDSSVPNSGWFILSKGDNVFLVDAATGLDPVQIEFTFNTLYEGV